MQGCMMRAKGQSTRAAKVFQQVVKMRAEAAA